jgi:excisionase family DNA binding protein
MAGTTPGHDARRNAAKRRNGAIARALNAVSWHFFQNPEKMHMSDYYTTRELAALLRVKERKIYDMAAQGVLPLRRVTGKLLFPRQEISDWLGLKATALAAAPEREKPLIASGGHDPLLEWALRESQSGIAGLFDGALDGLARAENDQCIVAGLHIPEAQGWNAATVAEKFGAKPWVLIEWCRRRRGLIFRPGLDSKPTDLRAARGFRFQARQAAAGSELVLDRLLAAEKMTRADLHLIETVERSETDLALALADGKADLGLGLEAAARQYKLDFLGLIEERFDLLVWRKAYFDPPFQKLLALGASDAFKTKARTLGGYNIANFGAVHWNGAV